MLTKVTLNGNILNRAVLVVNTNYAPLDICTAKRAICLWFLDKVEVIESYRESVHSPSLKLMVPSVVKLKQYIHYNNLEVILSRRNILMRDQHTCQYCGTKSAPLTIDHVIPRERGGDDQWDNLVTACISCNLVKGNRTPEEARMQIRRSPRRPNRIYYFQQYVKKSQTSWRPYLFMEPF